MAFLEHKKITKLDLHFHPNSRSCRKMAVETEKRVGAVIGLSWLARFCNMESRNVMLND